MSTNNICFFFVCEEISRLKIRNLSWNNGYTLISYTIRSLFFYMGLYLYVMTSECGEWMNGRLKSQATSDLFYDNYGKYTMSLDVKKRTHMRAIWRLKSACAFAQSCQSLPCSHVKKTLHLWSSKFRPVNSVQTTNAQADRLRECTG